ncbi:MAG: hypothetical protein ACRD2Z_13745 [Thermoanaerobaculia bacterium]
MDAEVVEAEILEERAPAAATRDAAHVWGLRWLPGPPPAGSGVDRTARPTRGDFWSWRSMSAGSPLGPASRHLPWPRLLGFVAGVLLFIALVAFGVLVGL